MEYGDYYCLSPRSTTTVEEDQSWTTTSSSVSLPDTKTSKRVSFAPKEGVRVIPNDDANLFLSLDDLWYSPQEMKDIHAEVKATVDLLKSKDNKLAASDDNVCRRGLEARIDKRARNALRKAAHQVVVLQQNSQNDAVLLADAYQRAASIKAQADAFRRGRLDARAVYLLD